MTPRHNTTDITCAIILDLVAVALVAIRMGVPA